jgi:hypothetical protein
MTRRSDPQGQQRQENGFSDVDFVLAQGVPPNPRGSEAVETKITAPLRIKCFPILRRKNFPVDNALLPGVNECAYLGDLGHREWVDPGISLSGYGFSAKWVLAGKTGASRKTQCITARTPGSFPDLLADHR